MRPTTAAHLSHVLPQIVGYSSALVVFIYYRLRQDGQDDTRLERLRERADQSGGVLVGEFVDPPGEYRGWQEFMSALWRHPGPNRVALAHEVADFGLGIPDGRWEYAVDVYTETGGGKALTSRLNLENTTSHNDVPMLNAMHEARLAQREQERVAEAMQRLRRRR